jgi:hypothetical protein
MRWGSTDWIDLAQDKEMWSAIENALLKFRVPQNAGNFLRLAEDLQILRKDYVP